MKKPDLSAIAAQFRTRSFRVGGYSMAAAAMVLAIVIVLNMLVAALPAGWTQFDITAQQLFTISDQTQQVLGMLEEDVTVYWVVRDGYEDTTLQRLLEIYQGRTDRLKVVKKDPDVYPTFLQQYTDASAEDNALVVESAQRSTYIGFDGIYEYDYSEYYYTGSYDVSFVGESALTSAIYYVTNQDLPKLYTLTGHGEASLSANFSNAVEKENVQVEELTLLTGDVPDDSDCLMILQPATDISAEELTRIQEYLQNGGNLLLITDPQETSGSRPNLDALMARYGVSETAGVVLEGDSNYYAYSAPYYLLPDLGTHTITAPLVSGGYYVLLGVAHGITISEELDELMTVTSLLDTSDAAYSKVAGYDLSTYEYEDGDIAGPFSLGVAITETIDDGLESNVIWFSSGALVDDDASEAVAGGNQDLFLNAVNYLCGQDSSISIHAKSLSYEYLTMDSGTATGLSLLILGVLPVGTLAVGIVIRYRRKHR